MFKKLLVPLDHSKTAESVLPYARFLAKKLDADVELLEVIDSNEIASNVSAEQARLVSGVRDYATGSSAEYLAQVCDRLPGIRTRCRVADGMPAAVIIDAAAADQETLIVMASHGRSGIHRWLLGSVAEKVLRGTSNPLLLIRASEEAPAVDDIAMNSIVVPLDGSELAESALGPAIDLARSLKLEIVLVRVYELPSTAYYRADDFASSAEPFIPSYRELVEAMSREAREYIDSKVNELRGRGLEQLRGQVVEGKPAEEIIKLARGIKGSMIAMCTHGRSGLKRWVLGSVTEKVVHDAGSPVLVVRAKG